MPLIIMGRFFEFNVEFGSWNETNFLIYQFIAYQVVLLQKIIGEFPAQIRVEKFWNTVPILIIAPISRIYLLFGIFFSQLFLISIPFIIVFIIAYNYYPISLFTILFIIGLFLMVALIFSGVGMVLSVFAISNENIWTILNFGISIAFIVSCLTYPFNIFPDVIKTIINLNPLYYLFEVLRYSWIENDIFLTVITYPFHIIILILSAIVLPTIGVVIFNYIFKKFGIVGY